MSVSMEREEIAEIAKKTGLTEKEVLEIAELVGANRASIIREAMILRFDLARIGSSNLS